MDSKFVAGLVFYAGSSLITSIWFIFASRRNSVLRAQYYRYPPTATAAILALTWWILVAGLAIFGEPRDKPRNPVE